MQLQFNSELDYQKQAINSVIELFNEQPKNYDSFSVALTEGTEDLEKGRANKLVIDYNKILENMQKIQQKNNISMSKELHNWDNLGKLDFCIEMETGTGKTYVYLRTILELYQLYGFSRFIIVVPSVAIKEGVLKNLKITKEHFRDLYNNICYNYSVYDSKKLEQIRSFAISTSLEIMVMTIQAFNKDNNIINQHMDKILGKPIDFIRETKPILIIDEPQSVIATGKKKADNISKKAIKSLNSLAIFRYSATHINKSNILYTLNAVDAYQQKLVKEIIVKSVFNEDKQYNTPYIELKKITNSRTQISASLELNYKDKQNTTKRKIFHKISKCTILEDITGLELYKNYIVDCICAEEKYISFKNGEVLYINKVLNDINYDDIQSQQIKEVIKKHFEKQETLNSNYKNDNRIKVLTLFFIDKVANYRTYDESNKKQLGKFAKCFESHAKIYIKEQQKTLFPFLQGDIEIDEYVKNIHNGYFAQDNKGKFKDSKGDTKKDGSTYNLIMKDKEKLLNIKEPLRFIFSHSALKEGWDNPNIFQICTLNETKSETKKRQEIGRGLRIAVNQLGNRVHDKGVNKLTIVANESYEDFADSLQKEMVNDAGIKFNTIEQHFFANILYEEEKNIGQEQSIKIFNYLKNKEYINEDGLILTKCINAIKYDTFIVPEEFDHIKDSIKNILDKYINNNPRPTNNDNTEKIFVKQKMLDSSEFQELWEKIKYKTVYNVSFDNTKLIEVASCELHDNLKIPKPSISIETGKIDITESGVNQKGKMTKERQQIGITFPIPNILNILQQNTNLTRRTIFEIIKKSKTVQYISNNPDEYIKRATNLIKSSLQTFMVDGIKYTKFNEYFCLDILTINENEKFSKERIEMANKSIYSHNIFDSKAERRIAQDFEKEKFIKIYVKLPPKFRINTPLGTYNPDWAVVVEENNTNKLFFIMETKGTNDNLSLRKSEKLKIECSKQHFKAMSTDVKVRAGDISEIKKELSN